MKYPEYMRKSFSTTNVVEAINGQLEIMRRNSGSYFHSENNVKLTRILVDSHGVRDHILGPGKFKSEVPGQLHPGSRRSEYEASLFF